jgi:hypothetical protein
LSKRKILNARNVNWNFFIKKLMRKNLKIYLLKKVISERRYGMKGNINANEIKMDLKIVNHDSENVVCSK